MFLQDLRLAIRMLWKSRGVTALSILSIALGIGLTAGIFSVEDAMILRPLPIARPGEVLSAMSWGDDGRTLLYGWPDCEDVARAGAGIGEVVAYTRRASMLARDDGSFFLLTHAVTPNYFSVLGVRAEVGQASVGETGGRPGAVLGHRTWMRIFGGDPAIVGKTVVVNGKALAVAGVMPAEFIGLNRGVATDLWVSADTWFDAIGRRAERQERDGQFEIVVRMKPGVTPERAAAQMDAAIRGSGKHKAARAGTAGTVLEKRFAPDWSKQLFVGGGSVIVLALVLFIACANVAQLRLAQAEARRKELGVRLAMGAQAWRVVRQLVAESCIVGLAGGGLGLLVARAAMTKATQFLTRGAAFLDAGIRLDHRVLLFAAAAAAFVVLLTGLAPARHAVRLNVAEVLKAEQGSAGTRTDWGKRSLVVGQLAVSVIFFGLAVLSTMSLWNALGIRPGLDPEKKLYILTVARGARTMNAATWAEQASARFAALPGVRGATFARRMPLSGSGGGATVRLEIPGQAPMGVHFNNVAANYFGLMGTRILAGRAIDVRDSATSAPVAVASQTLARQVFGDRNPLGQWIPVDGKPRQVVGIAEDGPSNYLHEDPEPFLYFPFAQMPSGDLTMMVETASEPGAMAQTIERELKQFDRRAVIFTSGTLREHMDFARSSDWMTMILSVVVGGFGVLLTAAGLFGVLQYGVNRRTRELGVRIALGATAEQIKLLVLRESLWMAAVGVPAGLLLLAAAARAVRSVTPGVTPFHPLAYGLSAAAAAAIALLAGWLPARRATRVDPVAALRAE
jgi:predicted permease